MSSIRGRLFFILLVATGAIWFSAVLWIQHSTRTEVEVVLDARLAEAAQMVSSLLSDGRVEVAGAARTLAIAPGRTGSGYSRQLSCQIWSLEGAMVGASGSAPEGRLTEAETGYSENVVDGERWRVYTEVNEDLGVRVMVGDRLTVRERLVSDVTRGLLIPALAILPVLAGLIWLSVGQGLAPLYRMANALAARSADNLEPVRAGPLPPELRPMGAALDALFARVAAARDRERNFSAYAAHELKTPLSAIKTQAQVAAMAPDEDTRRHALAQIERGVARTDRMVRQLLELAAVDGAAHSGAGDIDIGDVLAGVLSSLERTAEAKQVHLRCTLPKALPMVPGDPVMGTLAVRNVVENAIGASSDGDTVEIRVSEAADFLRVAVLDRGPGIAEKDRSRITERFFRGANAPEGGSGLGLAIATAAMQQLGGAMDFRRRDTGGEQVTLTFRKAVA
ncbi:ATP-binding protein [Ponticoccus sp. (in: a-proteobacteria)]|uniref:ATP-binding protein n=1 Tax=Ponticoccus sp. (in: a-proteobacteria) TaxID=1925025 RepID=UPI003AB30EDF